MVKESQEVALTSTLDKFLAKSPKDLLTSLRNRIARTSPSPRITTVRAGPLAGGRIFIDANAFVGWQQMVDGSFDSFIYDSIGDWSALEGSVVWDIGAHFGYHSLSFAALVGPRGRVFSFEPNPHNAKRLRMNIDLNGKSNVVGVVDCALANADGEALFSFSANVDDSTSSGSHLEAADAPLNAEHYDTFRQCTVKTRQIDTILAAGEVLPASIVKIDVEGAESFVLEGGKRFFATYRPVVFMEVHSILSMFKVTQYFRMIGYELTVLDEKRTFASTCFICARPA